MTDEAIFQAALDAEPDNHAVRHLFAAWLAERGDWRAEGCRWMGSHSKRPLSDWTNELRRQPGTGCGWYSGEFFADDNDAESSLPAELFARLKPNGGSSSRYGDLRSAEEALCRAVAAAAR